MKSLVLIFYLLPVAVVSAADNIGKTYHVYHKLGNNDEMKPRGTIQIAPDEDSVLVATFHSDKSAQLDTTAFDNMVESNGLYTVIALEEGDNKKPSKFNTQKYISASVPGCSLRRANLREEISLSISPTGKLLSVSYRPLISPLAPKTCKQLPTLSDKPSSIFSRETNEENMPFKTTVSFDSHNPMMEIPTILPNSRPPPGLKWYRKNAKNGFGSEGVGTPGVPDEQPSGFKSSFLYRYWYIIVPMAIMGLFGGADEEEAQKARVAGASSGSVAAAGAAVAAGSQPKQRRGKRD